MKAYIVFSLMIAMTWGLLPAQADVNKINFKLVNEQPAKVDPNEAIYLKARVNELEKEVAKLKTAASIKKEFGLAYIDKDGNLKCRSEDGGGDWSWDGKTFFRTSTSLGVAPAQFLQPQPFTLPQNNCLNGQCPVPNRR